MKIKPERLEQLLKIAKATEQRLARLRKVNPESLRKPMTR
jgi:hypothetical protein